MKIYDLSPTLHPGIAVWPGDTPFSRESVMRIRDGESVNLSSIRMSLHTGAHMDAPWHFQDRGISIDEVPLDHCVGSAVVVHLAVSGAIRPADLEAAVGSKPKRLLVCCNPDRSPDLFPEPFPYFSEEAARFLAAAGVCLVGTDSPSVDHVDSKDLPAHRAFGEAGIVILENLLLEHVPEGEYDLTALPLKIAGADGSPVRAILRAAMPGAGV